MTDKQILYCKIIAGLLLLSTIISSILLFNGIYNKSTNVSEIDVYGPNIKDVNDFHGVSKMNIPYAVASQFDEHIDQNSTCQNNTCTYNIKGNGISESITPKGVKIYVDAIQNTDNKGEPFFFLCEPTKCRLDLYIDQKSGDKSVVFNIYTLDQPATNDTAASTSN